nr:RAD50-interacting protein 1-like [Dermatophagoides farinae]
MDDFDKSSNMNSKQLNSDEIKKSEMINEINDMRNQLFNRLVHLDLSARKLRETIRKFDAKVVEAKAFVRVHKESIDDGSIDIDRPLANVMLCERAKSLAQLMKMAQEKMTRLRQETGILRNQYRDFAIETIGLKIAVLHGDYIALVKYFDLLIQIKVSESSQLYTMLKEFFIEDIYEIVPLMADIFKYTFNHIGWPQINNAPGSETSNHLCQYRSLFCKLFRFLLELEHGIFPKSPIPNSETIRLTIFDSNNNDRVIYHAFELLFDPFVKRFDYHFMDPGSKLNDLQHPEWFLCSLEQWITVNEKFFRDLVDPVLLDFFGDDGKSATVELISCFVKLIEKKLQEDLPKMADDDLIFIRTMDELVIFSEQVNLIVPDLYENDPKLNPLFVIFSDNQNFKRFFKIERNRINEIIEAILDSETSWQLLFGHDLTFDSKFIICEAADEFASLVNRQIERSKHIPLEELRAEFLHSIIDMIDDYRLRLSQSIHDLQENWPFSDKFFGILNTFDFIHSISVDFVTKQTFPQSDSDRVNKMFIHMIEEITDRIINTIVSDFISNLSLYKQLKWHGMSLKDEQPSEVTKEAVTLFNDISAKIYWIQKNISKNLFNRLIHEIAGRLQDAFFDNFIMESQFNRDGIKQLQFDFEHAFKAIFIAYSDRNIVFTFSTISDCLVVFNLSPQTYHIVQARHKVDSESEFRMYLQTLGIYSLKPSTVLALIDRRVGFN